MANVTFNQLVAAVKSLLCWDIKNRAYLIAEIMESSQSSQCKSNGKRTMFRNCLAEVSVSLGR